MRIPFILLAALVFSGNVLADGDMTVRHQLGVGMLDGESYQHAGARLLLNAKDAPMSSALLRGTEDRTVCISSL